MEALTEHDPVEIGPFRLRGRLGAGGMGRVYLGEAGDGTPVAIKVVHPGLAHDTRFRARFRREVQVSRRVTGPWVAAVVDADPDAELPWLATQYVSGPSLETAVTDSGPLAPQAVRALGHALALALGAIHGAGMVHRDLKPSNVLLAADHPRLIDFGISRAIDGTRMTSTGVVIGTPAFMSPEQIAGEDTGPASDVFSLGSVLAYAATGCGPFGDVSPVALMLRITQQEPDLAAVPDPLRGPIAACLAKRPRDRPTAAELARRLAPPEPLQLTLPARRRIGRRAVLGIAGAAALTVAGGAGLVAALPRDDPAAPGDPPAGGAVDLAPAGRVRWRVPLPATERSGEPWVTAGIVDGATLYTCVLDLDGDACVVAALDTATGAQRWGTAVGDAGGRARTLQVDGVVPEMVAVRDGLLVVATTDAVAALDARTGERVWEQAPVEQQLTLSAQPVAVADGVLVVAEDPGIVARDVRTGARLWSEPVVGGGALVAARDGRCLHNESGRVMARDLRTGAVLWSHDQGVGSATSVTVGDTVVVGYTGRSAEQASGRVVALDPGTGGGRWVSPGRNRIEDEQRLRGPDVRVVGGPVGGPVVVQQDGTTLRGVGLGDGAERWTFTAPGWEGPIDVVGAGGVIGAAPPAPAITGYSPRRTLIALDADSGTPRWTLEPPSGRMVKPFAAGGGDVYVTDDFQAIEAVTAP